jgi:hypothetical protein
MLVTAGALGAVLVHDGEVGTDEAKLAYADQGDLVELKGDLAPFAVPQAESWAALRPFLHDHTVLLVAPGLDVPVLLTGLGDVPEDEVVIEGAVRYNGAHPDGGQLLVVDVTAISEPFFDWA